ISQARNSSNLKRASRDRPGRVNRAGPGVRIRPFSYRDSDYLSKWIECLNTAALLKRLRIQGASRSRNVQAGCRSWSLLHRRDASKFLKEILYEDNFFAFVLGLRCGDSNCQS